MRKEVLAGRRATIGDDHPDTLAAIRTLENEENRLSVALGNYCECKLVGTV
jgi:hypothetical protein